MPESFTAEQTYHLAAPVDRVYRALLEPDQLVRWFLSSARVEPKDGGAFAFDWIGGYRMESTLTHVVPDQEVGFRWVDREPDGSSVTTDVRFRLESKGTGTLLHLRHTGFHSPRHFAECASRWAYYLTNLKSVLDHETDLRSEFDW